MGHTDGILKESLESISSHRFPLCYAWEPEALTRIGALLQCLGHERVGNVLQSCTVLQSHWLQPRKTGPGMSQPHLSQHNHYSSWPSARYTFKRLLNFLLYYCCHACVYVSPHTCGSQRITFGNCSHHCPNGLHGSNSDWEACSASAPALNLLEGGWNSILCRYGRTGAHSLVPRQQPHLRSQTP